MTPKNFEVAVVGAGPAGSFAAQRLAERGHEVVLVDENDGPREGIVCTGIVGREAFDRLDLPDFAALDTIRRARFCSPSGAQVVHEPRRPMARVVDRTLFDASLTAAAVRAGAVVLKSCAVRRVEKSGAGIVLTAREGERPRSIRARALVVATGYRRRLHKTAGLGRPSAYVHGIHADLPFPEMDAAELYFGRSVAPGFFAWVVPFGDGRARLGVLATKLGHAFFRRFLESEPVRSRLPLDLSNGGRAVVRERMSSRGIVQGPVTPSFADATVAVGEAAGQVKTTTAGGIYYGMIGAEIAADVLSGALRKNRLEASRLQRYETAWRDRLGPEIRTGFQLQRLALSMTDPDIDRLFRALGNGLAAPVRAAVAFDWHRAALEILFRRGGLGRFLGTQPCEKELA